MNLAKWLLPSVVALAFVVAPAAQAMDHNAMDHGDGSTEPAGHDHAHARGKISTKPQRVEVAVTKEGFEPATVTVKSGKPVKLVVTRKVERTCATDIVMKDFGVNQPLPLNQPVTIVVTPKKPGEYRFACGMDMIAGALKAE